MATDYIRAFSVQPKLGAYLDEMVESGLYGETVEEVTVHLIQRGVQQGIESGLLKPPYWIAPIGPEFAEVDEPPFSCNHKETDAVCDAPGCLGQIPF